MRIQCLLHAALLGLLTLEYAEGLFTFNNTLTDVKGTARGLPTDIAENRTDFDRGRRIRSKRHASDRSNRTRSTPAKEEVRKYTSRNTVDVLGSMLPAGGELHPFTNFEGWRYGHFKAYLCSFVLCFAGVLCAAGGIGGGGIYVTVLMVAGGLSVTDAVPLSKTIVFLGSISSLILNMRKSLAAPAGGKQQAPSLIDYNICRLVVPNSVLGTFLGVILNRALPSWVILLALTGILVFITVGVCRTAYKQFRQEQGWDSSAPAGGPAEAARHVRGESQGKLANLDVVLCVSLLVIVIACGTLRYHSQECHASTYEKRAEACNHPAIFWLPHGSLEGWMAQGKGTIVSTFSFVFPLCYCVAVSAYYLGKLTYWEGWGLGESIGYCFMALMTGCLAGLVGVGGGLIYAPFFLLMKVDPAIAVASSSTCVLPTACSTSLQYFFTDRVILSLTMMYGFINLVASWLGTSLVHYLQDAFAGRKSFISMIVVVGVGISTVLAVYKFITKLVVHPQPHYIAPVAKDEHTSLSQAIVSLVDLW